MFFRDHISFSRFGTPIYIGAFVREWAVCVPTTREERDAHEATPLSDSSHGRSEIGVGNNVAKYAHVLTRFKDRSSSIRVKVATASQHHNNGATEPT